MKKILRIFLLVIITMLFSNIITQAQTLIARNVATGDYPAYTLYTGVNSAVGDTSDVYKLPADIDHGIFYIETDTVTTSDTLKSMVIQESADNIKWVNSGFTFSNITAAGTVRKATTEVSNYFLGRFFRFVFAVGGSGAKIDFKLKFVPKL